MNLDPPQPNMDFKGNAKMPIKVIKKSASIMGRIEHFTSLSDITYKTSSPKYFTQELYKLGFIFEYGHLAPDNPQHINENWEYICWENSPLKKQAESIGWVTDVTKLPKFDNDDLYLPHHLRYDNKYSYGLRIHSPHIKASAPEPHQNIGGTYNKAARSAA